MMIYLHKALPVLLSPIFLVMALVIVGMLLRRNWFILLALGVLWAASTPIVANFALGHWKEMPVVQPLKALRKLTQLLYLAA